MRKRNEAKSRGSIKGAVIRWVFDIGGVEEAAKLLNITADVISGWLRGDGVPNEEQRRTLQTRARELRLEKTGATVVDREEQFQRLRDSKKKKATTKKVANFNKDSKGGVLSMILSRLENLENQLNAKVDAVAQDVSVLRKSLGE